VSSPHSGARSQRVVRDLGLKLIAVFGHARWLIQVSRLASNTPVKRLSDTGRQIQGFRRRRALAVLDRGPPRAIVELLFDEALDPVEDIFL
jgi:hypothetical protein